MAALPIEPLVPEIAESLRASPNLVLEAPPGAGKTTRVPPALLEVIPGEIWVLEPRRLAARLAARWADLRQNETFRLWCRWSLRAALAGLLVAGIMALIFPRSDSVLPLRAPEVEIPSLSAP